MKAMCSIALSMSAWILLAGSVVSGRQQGELTGVRGLPVEGHDLVAGVEIIGTKLFREPGFQKMRERFRSNGADLQLGRPLEKQTLCRFTEILRDVLTEQGFSDPAITHDARPTYGDPRQLTLTFTIIEGKRSRRTAPAAVLLSPAQRCSR
jgi:outer membrane protein assembly factor BamA